MSSVGTNFCRDMGLIEPHFLVFASKFPLEDLKSYEIKDTGEFKLKFSKNNKGNASNEDEEWEKTLANVMVTMKKVVTGSIDKDNKVIRIDSGCLQATKTKYCLPITASLVEVQVGPKTIKITGEKLSFHMSKELNPEDIMGTKITWKA